MTTCLIKIPVFTHASHVTKFSTFIFKMKREAWSLDLYRQMTRLWEPSCESEIVLKLTKGPKNRFEAFCGVLRSSVSRAGSAIRVDRPETMLDCSSIASTLGTLEREPNYQSY